MNKSSAGILTGSYAPNRPIQAFAPLVAGVRQMNAHHLIQPFRCQAAATIEDAPSISTVPFQTAANEMPAPRGGKLKERATAYIEEHRIRAYEADPDQRTTIVTMSNLLQVRHLSLLLKWFKNVIVYLLQVLSCCKAHKWFCFIRRVTS